MKNNNHGFITDPSRLRTDLSPERLAALRRDLEAVFQPNTDPTELSKELRMIAEKELGERPEVLRANLKELKRLIEEEEKLNARTDDLFLAAFIRGRKHDVGKALQCIKNFYEFKSRYPEMYSFAYPSKYPALFDQNHFSNIPGLDRKGRRICCILPGRVNLDEVPLHLNFQLGTSVLEMMLHDLTLQVAGTVIIFDMAGLTLYMQARLITPTVAWHLAMAVQDKIPMRLKAVHIINQPFYFNAAYALFKPLLKKKIRKRIFMHGDNYEALHEHIDPDNLPAEWGGNLPPFTSELSRTLLHLNEHKFKEWEQYSYKGIK